MHVLDGHERDDGQGDTVPGPGQAASGEAADGLMRDLALGREIAAELIDRFGPPRQWDFAVTRPTLAEAILDAVFSIRMRHDAVDSVIGRFRLWVAGRDRTVVGARDLVAALEVVPHGVLSRNRSAGRPKVEIAAEAAGRLGAAGIDGTFDLRDAVCGDPGPAREAWLSVKGLGEQSWCHLRMLAGCPAALPGPLLRRWLGGVRHVGADRAGLIIAIAAHELGAGEAETEYAMTMAAGDPLPVALLDRAG